MDWTHYCCDNCWDEHYEAWKGAPFRINNDVSHTCCLCGSDTASGIRIRENPKNLDCGGKHEADS